MRLFEGTPFDVPPRCDRCEELEADCNCPPLAVAQIPPEKQTLKIAVEKRKKGKMVTVIRGLAEQNDHAELLTKLKNHCGSGGTMKDGNIEIQGDHSHRMRTALKEWKYRLK